MISEENKELATELKRLKNNEKRNVSELVLAEEGKFYPQKIQQTIEEIRVTKLRTKEYMDKIIAEKTIDQKNAQTMIQLEAQLAEYQFRLKEVSPKEVPAKVVPKKKPTEKDLLVDQLLEINRNLETQRDEMEQLTRTMNEPVASKQLSNRVRGSANSRSEVRLAPLKDSSYSTIPVKPLPSTI